MLGDVPLLFNSLYGIHTGLFIKKNYFFFLNDGYVIELILNLKSNLFRDSLTDG